jgi:hypothetical protein
MSHPQKKSDFVNGLESLMNSPENPLRTKSSPSSKDLRAAAEGKKKKKNEDKERSKSRVDSLGGV